MTTCRVKSRHYGRRSQQQQHPSSALLLSIVVIVIVAFFARSADCQSVQQQQKSYYVDPDDGAGEVIKSKIRPDSYSHQDSSSHSNSHQSDSVGSASTVYGEQYGAGVLMQHDQPLLDEEAQESISSGSMNNHRLPQYTRGAANAVEGKNVGNRAVVNNYHPGVGITNNNPTSNSGYAVDSAYSQHYNPQDLIQDQNYQLEFKYHDYDKMTKFLRTTSSRFPNLTALYSIGKSVQGILSFILYLKFV